MIQLIFIILALTPFFGNAQTVHQDLIETVPAEVVEVVDSYTRDIIGTETNAFVQDLRVNITGGLRKGTEARFENDLVELEVGDAIFVNRLVSIDGVEYYEFKDVDRRGVLLALALLFVAVLIFFARGHGTRALVSLVIGIGILFFVLVPLLLKGYDPVLVSILVAAPVLASAILLTHGFRAQSVIAFLGTFGAVVITGILATLAVSTAHFTGLSSDEAIYLNFSTKGSLDFGGLLLGSIIIGILGILDDVAITQAAVVRELAYANTTLRFRELYERALRVGRDHVSSLVNTLSFAYIGASLPLVLLLVKAEAGFLLSVNQELVAVELIRIFIGSIGLILAVPLTTALAAFWYGRYPSTEAGDGHTHHHIH